jgi:hypothetical protein
MKIVLRLGRDDKSRHAPTLALSALVQQFGENALAVQTFAAIELVEANRDVSTQSRKLLLLLPIEADESAHKVARVAEPALRDALSHVLLQRFRKGDVQRCGSHGRFSCPGPP